MEATKYEYGEASRFGKRATAIFSVEFGQVGFKFDDRNGHSIWQPARFPDAHTYVALFGFKFLGI